MQHMVKLIPLIAALAPSLAQALEMTSICYSRGSEAEGMTGFVHHIDGRAIRIDSPWSNDSRSRVAEWQDDGFATEFYERLTPVWTDIPTDVLDQCDDGWRDTIVIRYDDGTMDMREGSCAQNPVAVTLDSIFMEISSVADDATETFTDGPIAGVYEPCHHEW